MQISLELKGRLVGLHEAGKSQLEISKLTGIPQGTISRVLKRINVSGIFERKVGSGRPPKASKEIRTNILAIQKNNVKLSLRKVARRASLNNSIIVSRMMVKRIYNASLITSRIAVSKPLLSKRHIETRFLLAKSYYKYNSTNIKNVIFSDESKFNLFYSDGRVHVWCATADRFNRQCLNQTVKFGGKSVMVWACFSYSGVGRLTFIDGIMNSEVYVNILSENLLLSAEQIGINNLIFQQDMILSTRLKQLKHF